MGGQLHGAFGYANAKKGFLRKAFSKCVNGTTDGHFTLASYAGIVIGEALDRENGTGASHCCAARPSVALGTVIET
jgi:hypothetical protein